MGYRWTNTDTRSLLAGRFHCSVPSSHHFKGVYHVAINLSYYEVEHWSADNPKSTIEGNFVYPIMRTGKDGSFINHHLYYFNQYLLIIMSCLIQ